MLCLLFLICGLAGLGWPLVNYSEKPQVQVIVPEKIHSVKSGGDSESEVFYKIKIEGTTYVVKLVQKMFLPQYFNVYGYDEEGIMKPLEQQTQSFCYYQGHIQGYPKSLAIINTCNGLRGLLQFENFSYGIEPLESSVGFEHLVYQVKHEKKDIPLYAEKDVSFKNTTYKIKSVKPSDFSQYIETHIVVEKALYKHLGGDTAVVTQKIFQLVGLMNAFFSSLNLTVILASLELWIDENKIATTGDVNELLHRFQNWKKSYLVLRPHDMAFLLVYREAPSYIGAIFQGMMCDKDYGGGIALYPRTITLDSFGIILVQLLSLSMGIGYDDINRCHCPGAVCIMDPAAIHSGGMKMFSNCSMDAFAHFLTKQMSQCLQNQPHLEPVYRESAICGNGIVEQGEACDCGTEEECQSNEPVCCEYATCTLKSSAKCAHGPCCENCEIKKGKICRPARDECDFDDHCNGSSIQCGEDIYVINGNKCGDIEFGSDECFQEVNSKNDISGNCGIVSPGIYKPCAPDHVKCGKLICLYHKKEVLKHKEAITIYRNVSGQICVGVEYPLTHEENEKMWVQDGTRCAPEKVCKNKQCVDESVLGFDCTPRTCNNNGVCNNKKHCVCNPQYQPPNCENPQGRSAEDEHELFESIPEKNYIESPYHTKPKKWPFFLIIPFFIILSVLIAMLAKVYYQRKKWKSEDYISDEDLESESEPKASKGSKVSVQQTG
ncbi:PREDICTED: disintegrin and metalloproteinase domain-containing protein 2 isoform X2 [Chinchilla lanigera]|uniref:disintegrin and metalloproteinase domain-containing protein 2 isoform X2 n=1 Tax=Chinchilla lanigera TaxID=34839 RepID=UPI00038EE6F5|nr:PREDICTED: disintegrin and metalloproteinase domain-containing protein 2 isoform X2 [Chinchilla lanigera]